MYGEPNGCRTSGPDRQGLVRISRHHVYAQIRRRYRSEFVAGSFQNLYIGQKQRH